MKTVILLQLPLNSPLTIVNDNNAKVNGCAITGKRLIGWRTLMQLPTIERMLTEELNGQRSLTPEHRQRLMLDSVDLKRQHFSKPTPSNDNASQCLSAKELMVVFTVMNWLAYDRGWTLPKVMNLLIERFSVTDLAQFCPDQYDAVVKYLISFHSVHGNRN